MNRLSYVLVLTLLAAGVAWGQQQVSPQQGSGRDQASTKSEGRASDSERRNNDSKATGPKGTTRPNRTKRMPSLTPEREAAAMTFVRQHHPELASLLLHLKQRQSREYQRAVMDLFRASERLAQMKDVDERAYKLELDIWKVRSRVELIAARVAVDNSPQLQQQLREALNEQVDLQKEKLVRERERIANRLQKLDEQIDRLESGRQQYLERQVRIVTRASRTPAKSRVKKAVPTSSAKKASDASRPNSDRPASQEQR